MDTSARAMEQAKSSSDYRRSSEAIAAAAAQQQWAEEDRLLQERAQHAAERRRAQEQARLDAVEAQRRDEEARRSQEQRHQEGIATRAFDAVASGTDPFAAPGGATLSSVGRGGSPFESSVLGGSDPFAPSSETHASLREDRTVSPTDAEVGQNILAGAAGSVLRTVEQYKKTAELVNGVSSDGRSWPLLPEVKLPAGALSLMRGLVDGDRSLEAKGLTTFVLSPWNKAAGEMAGRGNGAFYRFGLSTINNFSALDFANSTEVEVHSFDEHFRQDELRMLLDVCPPCDLAKTLDDKVIMPFRVFVDRLSGRE